MNELVEDSIFSERRAVRSLSIIIVGAGIGGLAIGLCMRKTGHDVRECASLLHMPSGLGAGTAGSATTAEMHMSKSQRDFVTSIGDLSQRGKALIHF